MTGLDRIICRFYRERPILGYEGISGIHGMLSEYGRGWVSAVISKIDQAGRISISAQQRRALGLDPGSPIVVAVVGNELRIRSMHAAMAELQAESGRFLQNEAASVDVFIAQRRVDVDGEEEVAASSGDAEQHDASGTGR